MATSIGERWQKKAYFRPNAEGGWDFYPWPETRLGYQIDNSTRLKLEQIEAKAMPFFWAGYTPLLLGLFCITDLSGRWLAEFAPGLSRHWAFALCIILFYALMALWSNVVRQRQVEALADLAPVTVTLSLEESRRNIARQTFFGHPKMYAIFGALVLALFICVFFINDREPDKYSMLPIFLPGAWYVLRAWRLIFSAAAI